MKPKHCSSNPEHHFHIPDLRTPPRTAHVKDTIDIEHAYAQGIAEVESKVLAVMSDREPSYSIIKDMRDRNIERKLVRKLDYTLLVLVSIPMLFSLIDRSNIGARIAGMEKDLNLFGERFDWLLTLYYIAYILSQSLAVAWKVFPPHLWAAGCVFLWGLISMSQAAVHNWESLMSLRFLLGIAEAGFGAGIPYLLSFFYLRHELGIRIGINFAATPLANMFTGALAYCITSGNISIAGWRLLFIVEGIPSILLAVVVFFLIPDSPDKARFLTLEEKQIAQERTVRQVGPSERREGLKWNEIGPTLIDPRAWLTALMCFGCNVSYSSLSVFLPKILSDMGFKDMHAQGLSAPPYLVSAIFTIVTPWIASRTRQQGLMIMVLCLIGGSGYLILATCASVGARYFAVFVCAAGIYAAIANILTWSINNQGSDTQRGIGLAVVQLIGQCGSLLGTRLYPASEGPYYIKGHSTCAAFMFAVTILAAIMRFHLVRQNNKLDKLHGKRDHRRESWTRSAVAMENHGPDFRYVL